MEKRVKKKDQIFQSQCDFGYNAEPQNSFKFVCKLYVSGIFTMTVNARWSKNMQQIYRRKPKSKCSFNKVALQLY